MERLLNLLQEFYGENRKFSNDDGLLTMTNGVENLSGAYAQTYIISLQGGFIKWLVVNDKIDLWSNTFTEKEERYFGEQPDFTFQSVKYTHLLMLLSISGTPIDFLCEIIK